MKKQKRMPLGAKSLQRGLDPTNIDNRIVFIHYPDSRLLTIQFPEHIINQRIIREIRTAKFVSVELERMPVGQPPLRVTFDDGSEKPYTVFAQYEDFRRGVPTKDTLRFANVHVYSDKFTRMSPDELRKNRDSIMPWEGAAKTEIEQTENGYKDGTTHHVVMVNR